MVTLNGLDGLGFRVRGLGLGTLIGTSKKETII